MKKAIVIVITALAAFGGSFAQAAEPRLTVLLTGDAGQNMISIGVSSDGRSYLIDSIVPLEVGGDLCSHPEAKENELVCEATSIGGFEVNAGGGDDTVTVSKKVPIPVTLRGGPGDDRLSGGGVPDKLIGGVGQDTLTGWGGGDLLYGGPGDDRLIGCSGSDVLRGEAGEDTLFGGSGVNTLVQ